MKRLAVAVALVMATPLGSKAIPVIPSFSSGSTISRTENKTSVREIIQSYHYNTGYTFTQSGTNLRPVGGGSMTPTSIQSGSQTINGITSSWNSINLSSKPQYEQVIEGANTQYAESLMGPGLAEYVYIDRLTESESITESQSVFTQ
jgi:hypothetical protein